MTKGQNGASSKITPYSRQGRDAPDVVQILVPTIGRLLLSNEQAKIIQQVFRRANASL